MLVSLNIKTLYYFLMWDIFDSWSILGLTRLDSTDEYMNTSNEPWIMYNGE